MKFGSCICSKAESKFESQDFPMECQQEQSKLESLSSYYSSSYKPLARFLAEVATSTPFKNPIFFILYVSVQSSDCRRPLRSYVLTALGVFSPSYEVSVYLWKLRQKR